MSRSDPQMKVRFPGDLKHRLAEAASANSRSINSEIIQRLEDSFRVATTVSGSVGSDPELGQLIVEMHQELMSRKQGSLLRRPRDPLSMLPVSPKSSGAK